MFKKAIFSIFSLLILFAAADCLAAIKVYPNPDTRTVSLSVAKGASTSFYLVLDEDTNANFSWRIATSPGGEWLGFDAVSGTGAATYSIKVTVDATSMLVGNYSAKFYIINPDDGTTIEYTVILTVLSTAEPPTPPNLHGAIISIYPKDPVNIKTIQGQTTYFYISIVDVNGNIAVTSDNPSFCYAIATSPNQQWLSAGTPSACGSSAYSVKMDLDATNLSPGTYDANIYITTNANSGVFTLPVHFTIIADSAAGVSMIPSGSVTLEAAPGQQKNLTVALTGSVPFSWVATSDAEWLTANPTTGTATSSTSSGTGTTTTGSVYSITVTADATKLMAQSMPYIGTISFVTNVGTVHQLTVLFYVNYANINAEPITTLNYNTSSWLNLVQGLNPVNMSGRLFVLMEHPQLVPYQVYAYRIDTNGPRLDLFSQWGRTVPNALSLAYANDVKTVNQIILGGFRLKGLEGNLIIKLMVGNDANNLTEIKRWSITIQPITGEWDLQELFYGNWFHYPDLLLMYEKGGHIDALWGQIPVSVDYGNAITASGGSLSICSDGVSFCSSNSALSGNADYVFSRTLNTVFGPMEFLYHVTQLDASIMQGTWQYRLIGVPNWSLPERFEAKTHGGLVIPYDAQRQAYFVNGTVRGLGSADYAVRFQVDTGAYTVLLDKNIAPYLGININDSTDPTYTAASCYASGGSGVGGTITTTNCLVKTITLDGKLSKNNVWVSFGDWPQPALLGMSFLEGLNISTNAADKSMTISY